MAFLHSHSKHIYRLSHVENFEETEMTRPGLLIKLAARHTTTSVLPVKCDALVNLPGVHQVGVLAQNVVTLHCHCSVPEGGLCQPMQLTNRTVTQPFGNSHGGRPHFKFPFPTMCSASLL